MYVQANKALYSFSSFSLRTPQQYASQQLQHNNIYIPKTGDCKFIRVFFSWALHLISYIVRVTFILGLYHVFAGNYNMQNIQTGES